MTDENMIKNSPAPIDIEGTKWQRDETSDENGYYFYNYVDPLPGGGVTDELTVTIHTKSNETIKPDEGDQYNVIVIYESTPVRYNENGQIIAVNWNTHLLQYNENGEIVQVFKDEEGNS